VISPSSLLLKHVFMYGTDSDGAAFDLGLEKVIDTPTNPNAILDCGCGCIGTEEA
jgi:hypothetical protein